MRVMHVASEVSPWSQTGGLGEVTGSLVFALARMGAEAALLSPLYREVRARNPRLEPTGLEVAVALGGRGFRGKVWVLHGTSPTTGGLYFLDVPELFDRDGLYGHFDDPLRFAALCQAAIDVAPKIFGAPADVFHGHDWQAGLVPLYLRQAGREAKTVFTIHNLAYQGVFDKSALPALGLDWGLFTFDQLEHDDRLSLMKAGLRFSTAVTTVSPTYAKEVLTPEHGRGLDGFLAHQVGGVLGIVNGIDVDHWDPSKDDALPARFGPAAIGGKSACRSELAKELGLELGPGQLLAGMVSRFTEQKGIDLVAAGIPRMLEMGVRLALLGSGDRWLEDEVRGLAAAFPGQVALRVAFDRGLSRRIFAGSDVCLLPSRFEPCGIAQMYAMRYGALPIARATGGLTDTIADEALHPKAGTGFLFERATVDDLLWTVGRAVGLYRGDPAEWGRMVGRAMTQDFSWRRSAAEYLALYERLCGRAPPPRRSSTVRPLPPNF